MIQRHITPGIMAALSDTPVVIITGARLVGKSTLVESIIAGNHPARLLTLDDPGVLAAARTDPAGFVAGLEGHAAIDEIQKAPGLLPVIKGSVDRDRRPGRFILTGSANVLLLPVVSESLAGRMEVATLWPFSQGEIEGRRETFIDDVFGSRFPAHDAARDPVPRADYLERIFRGGYPEPCARPARRRRAWFESYVATMLSRNVKDLADIETYPALHRLLVILAARSCSLLNSAELSRSAAIPQTTLKRYFGLLESTFLIRSIPAWTSGLGHRLAKAPKTLFGDTGLLAHLQGVTEDRFDLDPVLAGPLVENFVAMEMVKQAGWCERSVGVHHFRTHGDAEVDLVLEDEAGHVVGIEVKASATPSRQDFRGLSTLAEIAGKKFVRGVLIHMGVGSVPFAANLHAVPMSALWRRREGD